MRVVLDTAAFISGIRSDSGPSAELFRMVFRGNVILLMDHKLGLEYRDVALRQEHISASRLKASEILELIEALESFAEPVRVVWKPRPLSPDPNDDMIIDIAINAMADAVVTNNIKHFAAAGRRFHIPVLSPAQLLRRIRQGGRQ